MSDTTSPTSSPTAGGAEVHDIYRERYVVVGTNAEGVTIVLEAVTDPNAWTERLAHWRTPANSAPYDRDVHMSREVVKIEYRRLDDHAYQWL